MNRLLLLLLLLFALPAQARDTARANQLKTKADQAFRAGQFDAALTLLEQAYAADPQPRLIANQGLVLERLGRYADAVDAMERFLLTYPPDDKLQAARQILARLKPDVKIVSEPPGADVRIDDRERVLGKTPLELRLVAGDHVVKLAHPEAKPAEQAFSVKPGEPHTVRVTLERGAPPPVAAAPPPVAPPPPQPTPEPEPTRAVTTVESDTGGPSLRTWGWVTLGAGAAAAGAAVAMYVLGLDAADARDGAATESEWDAHHADVESFNLGYLVSGGVAIAAIGAGLALVLVDDGGAGVAAAPTPGGLVFSGRF